MPTELPSLELLRSLSDRHVLAAVANAGQLTRAGVAATTGLSKPTVSQSTARLIAAGVVREGARTLGGRGRAGTALEINAAAGCALAVQAGASGIDAEVVTLDGQVVCAQHRAVRIPVSPRALSSALRAACRAVVAQAPGPILAASVSVADPVDRRTGRVVEFPESPFLVGELDVLAILSPILKVTPTVGNDVSWALLAELDQGAAYGVEEVLQVYLDAGFGAAMQVGGRALHGARGLAGELGYSRTSLRLPSSRARRSVTLIEAVRSLGYLHLGTNAIDVAALVHDLDRGVARGTALTGAVAEAVLAHAYLLDPQLIVLSGRWGRHPALIEAVRAAIGPAAGIQAEVAVSRLSDDGPLRGVRLSAIDALLDFWTPRAAINPSR